MNNIEVELKFPLLNAREAASILGRVAGQGRSERQVDTYFNHPDRDFLAARPITEWLRIRETGHGAVLNYKHWHHTKEKRTVSCDEYETNIENAAAAKRLLEALGFNVLIVVDKTRKTWRYKDVEVAIDDVKELGAYVELEAKGRFKDIEEAKTHLYEVVKELDLQLGEQDLKGYPFLLLEKKGYKLA
jgi:adenylate cyclase class 2